jgi:hypothetical protein
MTQRTNGAPPAPPHRGRRGAGPRWRLGRPLRPLRPLPAEELAAALREALRDGVRDMLLRGRGTAVGDRLHIVIRDAGAE